METRSHLHQSLDELDRLPACGRGVLVVQGLYLLGDLPEPGLEVLCEGRGGSFKARIRGSVSAAWGAAFWNAFQINDSRVFSLLHFFRVYPRYAA